MPEARGGRLKLTAEEEAAVASGEATVAEPLSVCLKVIKNNKDFFDQSLDEIKLLQYIKRHDPEDAHNVLHIYDYFYHKEHP